MERPLSYTRKVGNLYDCEVTDLVLLRNNIVGPFCGLWTDRRQLFRGRDRSQTLMIVYVIEP